MPHYWSIPYRSADKLQFVAYVREMTSIWKTKEGVSIKPIGNNRYMFQFFHRLDVKRIMEGSLWTFGNDLFVTH